MFSGKPSFVSILDLRSPELRKLLTWLEWMWREPGATLLGYPGSLSSLSNLEGVSPETPQ